MAPDDERGVDLGPKARGGRVVLSRGPIIRWLEFGCALAGVCAVVALVLVLTAYQGQRHAAARDSCYLWRGIVQHVTPPARQAEARAWLARPDNPLRDCNRYADQVAH